MVSCQGLDTMASGGHSNKTQGTYTALQGLPRQIFQNRLEFIKLCLETGDKKDCRHIGQPRKPMAHHAYFFLDMRMSSSAIYKELAKTSGSERLSSLDQRNLPRNRLYGQNAAKKPLT